MVRQRIVDCFHLRIGQHLLIASVGLCNAEFVRDLLGSAPISGSDGDHLTAIAFLHRRDDLLDCNLSRAQDSPADFLCTVTRRAVIEKLIHRAPDMRARDESGITFVHALVPPSTVRFAPVMYDASGLATKATNAATSATVPKRFSAVLAFCGTAQSPAAGFKSVSIGPGWTLFTVMPLPPTSLDNPCVNILMAPFVAE